MLRALRRPVRCITLGIFTTIGVAWVFATGVARTGFDGDVVNDEHAGRFPLAVSWARRAGMVEFAAAYNCSLDVGIGSFEDIAPAWTRRVLLPPGWEAWAPERCTKVRSVTAYGWPRPALWRAIEHDENSATGAWTHRTFAGIRVADTWPGFNGGPPGAPPLTLPTRPLWPGFLADAAFYAAAWWLLPFIPRRLRRALRRRRGRCARCAYDLRGLSANACCPECGAGPP